MLVLMLGRGRDLDQTPSSALSYICKDCYSSLVYKQARHVSHLGLVRYCAENVVALRYVLYLHMREADLQLIKLGIEFRSVPRRIRKFSRGKLRFRTKLRLFTSKQASRRYVLRLARTLLAST